MTMNERQRKTCKSLCDLSVETIFNAEAAEMKKLFYPIGDKYVCVAGFCVVAV